jgi:ribosomal protein RSM22 (predicted rRNA methylase)
MAIAYLLKKLPGTFAVACRIFVEIKYRQPDFIPKTFLDFGAGLGNIKKFRFWKFGLLRFI